MHTTSRQSSTLTDAIDLAHARLAAAYRLQADADRDVETRMFASDPAVLRRAFDAAHADGAGAGSAWQLLRRHMALSASELHAALFLVAVRRAPVLRDQVAAIGRTSGASIGVDVVARCVHELDGVAAAAYGELAATGRLVRLGLLDCWTDGPGGERMLGATDRLMALAVGPHGLAPEVAALAPAEATTRALVEVVGAEPHVAALMAGLTARAVVVCAGAPSTGRRTLLRALAAARGVASLDVDCRRLASDAATCRYELRAIARECLLGERVPLLLGVDVLDPERLALVDRELLDLWTGPVLATRIAGQAALRWRRDVVEVDVGRPSTAARATLWTTALAEAGHIVDEATARALATALPLAPGVMHAAARGARAAVEDGALSTASLREAARIRLAGTFGDLATRVVTRQTWADLVLPAELRGDVQELIARVRDRAQVYEAWGLGAKIGRGLGVTALLSGPPGTGKTMTAGLIADELGMDLYQVDLAKVTSKWIGETEKHLGALFDAAEAGHAALLFDEADAMFGKRTQVSSSNDRHANLEVNYLLQRLERFEGVCLLTSNHEAAIDPAFQRRLAMHLRLPAPDVAQRAALWRAMLPTEAPTDGVIDVRTLARAHDLAGGHIRNAVVRAAFRAIAGGVPLSTYLLDESARREAETLGRVAALRVA